MNYESDYIKIVFGVKLKQQRQKKNWSLNDLAQKTNLSKSYLNEIENGKKHPKHDKIVVLSEALDCSYDDLVSTKLDKNLTPFGELIQSDFFQEIPLELFGISKSSLINIISDAPKKVTAFINTLIEISQNYNLGKERFYFAVMRSFQELHDNNFPDIEDKAEEFLQENNIKEQRLDFDTLKAYLEDKLGLKIMIENFKDQGALNYLRSLYIPEKKTLLINESLEENQKIFVLAKEIGFHVLGFEVRPHTYSWIDFKSFDEILNNFYASYFAGCILIPRKQLKEKLSEFFAQDQWDSEKFVELMNQFTNSPETFYYRLTNILSSDFGIKDLFYLCFVKPKNSEKIKILKELHLNHQQAPYSNSTNEHYCRRWIALKNIYRLKEDETITDAQISYYKKDDLGYFVFSTSQKNPFSDGSNRSYCLGILMNAAAKKKINFLKDKSVKRIEVGVTCESCTIKDCDERVAPPARLEKYETNTLIKAAVEEKRKEIL